MIYRVVVGKKNGEFDVIGRQVRSQIGELGISGVESVRFEWVYFLESASLTEPEVEQLARQLLADNVTESFESAGWSADAQVPPQPGTHVLDVALNHGVTDSTASQVVKAITQLGLACTKAKVVRRYVITGQLSDDDIDVVGRKILYNPVIEHIMSSGEEPFMEIADRAPNVEMLPLAGMSDQDLMDLSHNRLWLNLPDAKLVAAIKRGPGDRREQHQRRRDNHQAVDIQTAEASAGLCKEN